MRAREGGVPHSRVSLKFHLVNEPATATQAVATIVTMFTGPWEGEVPSSHGGLFFCYTFVITENE